MTLAVGIVGSGEMGLKYAEALARYTSGPRLVAVAGGTRASAFGGKVRSSGDRRRRDHRT